MAIVVLDGLTVNPYGDNPWDELKTLGDCQIFDKTEDHEIIDKSKDAEIILTNKVAFSRETFKKLPKLKYISVVATGYNVVDIQAAKEFGVQVSNVPVYGTDSVAQFTMGLILSLCHRIEMHHNAIKEGEWQKRGEFSFFLSPQTCLADKTLGIIGLGKIGIRLAKIAEAFGMNILAYNRSPKKVPELKNLKQVSLTELFKESDFVSLNILLTPETHHIINSQNLNLMKRTSFIINSSRGDLICEKDLADALNNEKIAGAALDVVSQEPITQDNPLLKAKNCILTPHMAWTSLRARKNILKESIENIRYFLSGKPRNLINP